MILSHLSGMMSKNRDIWQSMNVSTSTYMIHVIIKFGLWVLIISKIVKLFPDLIGIYLFKCFNSLSYDSTWRHWKMACMFWIGSVIYYDLWCYLIINLLIGLVISNRNCNTQSLFALNWILIKWSTCLLVSWIGREGLPKIARCKTTSLSPSKLWVWNYSGLYIIC